MRVLRGSCENLTTPTPLGPFGDLADAVGGPLARLIEGGADARTIGRAVLDELTSPALVVIEDVHWADEATLDALRVLGRRIDSTPSLVVATYRDDEAVGDHPLRVVLGELASAPGVLRLTVPPLSLAAVEDLAGPSGADAAAIYRLTDGNPFYVTEILAAGGETLPETVRDAVFARVASLGDGARRLLDAISLIPGGVEIWLLERVASGDLEHLEECLDAGVLTGDRDGVAFRHELARLAIEEVMPIARSRRLHAALIEALLAPPLGAPDPARLAHHAESAGDTAAILQHAPAAARQAATAGAHREAARQYARALRVGASLPAHERATLLEAYALEAQLTGRSADAADAWGEAASLFGIAGDHLGQGRCLAWLPRAFIGVGRNAEAEAASRSAIDVLEPLGRSAELARAYVAQGYVRMINRDNADGVAWGTKAATLAEGLGDLDTLAYSLNTIGTSHIMAGEIELGIEFLQRSLSVARENGLWLWVGPALTMLGTGLGEMYELERSERYLREHIAFAEEHDLWPDYSRAWLALVEVYTGRWDDAVATAKTVLAVADDTISRISALIALGRVRARRGDPGAWSVLDEALELARPGHHLQRLGHVHAARAEAAWLAEQPDRAASEASAAYPLALEKRHLWFAGELAYWQWRAGALHDAPERVAEPYRLLLDGSPVAAAEAWRVRGCPYEAARALVESDIEEHMLDGLAELERLGAGPAAKEARSRLRRLGSRSRAGLVRPHGPTRLS